MDGFYLVFYSDMFLKSLKSVMHTTKQGCLNPNLGQVWTNPNVGSKMLILTQL